MPDGATITRLLDLTELGNDTFLGGQPTTSTLDKVYGGQLVGQALAAARRTVDPRRRAHSVQATCLEMGRHDSPITYEVERIRDGRSFSVRSVVAAQEGRPLLRLMASFHIPEPGLNHAERMPDVPPPDSVRPLHEVIRAHSTLPSEPVRREWSGVDVRYIESTLSEQTRRGTGRQQLWIRVASPLPSDPAVHREVLTYLSDLLLINTALVPHGMILGDPELPRATLNHSAWLHADARTDEWLLIDQRSPRAVGARALSYAEVFTAHGNHIASFAQEGLIRPRGGLRLQLPLV